MSGTHFTRADWRPSKKRARQLRVKPYGGQKQAPAALLEAAKGVQFGSGVHRICKATKRDGTPCRKIALTHSDYCGAHGGWFEWKRRGILRKSGKREIILAEKAKREHYGRQAPRELIDLPIYRDASEQTRLRLIDAWETEQWQSVVRQISNEKSDTTL